MDYVFSIEFGRGVTFEFKELSKEGCSQVHENPGEPIGDGERVLYSGIFHSGRMIEADTIGESRGELMAISSIFLSGEILHPMMIAAESSTMTGTA